MISTTLRRLKPNKNPRSPPQLAANMNHCMRGPYVHASCLCGLHMQMHAHKHAQTSK